MFKILAEMRMDTEDTFTTLGFCGAYISRDFRREITTDTREEAETLAADLNTQMNHPKSVTPAYRAEYRYTVVEA